MTLTLLPILCSSSESSSHQLHFDIEADGQVGILMGWVYRPANEEIDIRRFLKQHPADKTGTIVTIAPFLMAFVLIQHILGVFYHAAYRNDPFGYQVHALHMGNGRQAAAW